MILRARRAAIPAVLILLTTAVTGVVRPAAAAAAEPPALTPEAQASQQARVTGSPVEVPSLLTENTKVTANPDGTFTAEVHAGPARFKDPSGAWRDVDLDLERLPDGNVAPKAHPRGLVISGPAGAGDHDVARLASGPLSLGLGWTGNLPVPDLDGTKATYREVRPGVDLVIDATRTGFEQFLVVKDRAAASQVTDVVMPWRTAGIVPTARPGGGLTLNDETGAYAGHVPPAVMWDATVGTISGEHLREQAVPMQVTHGPRSTITITPGNSFLTDPSTVYPVTIDPSPTLKPVYDAFVQDNISSDRSTSKELKLGYVMDQGRYFKARSFIKWSTSALRGKNVTGATMFLWNTHSWNCTAKEWQVWITDSVGTSTRWAKQPKWHSARPIATSTQTKGYSGCGAGYVAADVGPLFDWASDNNQTTFSTGLRSRPADEGSIDAHSWKKFSSSEDKKDPFVSITYNTRPSPPTALRIGGKDCTGGTTAYVSSVTGYPSAQATATDPDGTERQLTVQYFVAKAGSALPSAPTMTGRTTSGTAATAKVPASINLTENQTYQMYARTTDGLDTSATSGPCMFTVDNQGPALPPTVTSTDYPECVSNCVPRGGVGRSGVFTLGANGASDVTHYRYWFDGGAQITTAADSTGGPATVRIDPPPPLGARKISGLNLGGPRTLFVESLDAAGHTSGQYQSTIGGEPSEGYPLSAANGAFPVASWKFDEANGSGGYADSSGHGATMTLSGSAVSGDGNGDGGRALGLTGTGTAKAPLSLNRTNSRTTSLTARIDAFNGDVDLVRHEAYIPKPNGSGGASLGSDSIYVDATAKKFCAQAGQPQWLVCSPAAIRPGVWTRLAGGFDAMSKRVFISVDGVVTRSEPVVPLFDGGLQSTSTVTTIGTGFVDPITGPQNLKGAIDNLLVWDRLLQPAELGELAVNPVGRWELDQSGQDSSQHPSSHPLTTASTRDDLWSDYGHREEEWGSASFTGTDALSTATGNVIRTDQSFSVSAWVSPSEVPDTTRVAVSQDGVYQTAFTLGSRVVSGVPKWSFSLVGSDIPTSAPAVHVYGPAITSSDDWVHLVGVYDATTQQSRLYVNGAPASTLARTERWNATGPLHVGKARYATTPGNGQDYSFFKGGVDAVRVYAGVLTGDMVNRLYQTPDGQL